MPPGDSVSVTDDTGFLAGTAFRAHCMEIVRLLDAAQTRRGFDTTDAQAAVEQCARDARASGVLPEKLIVELKRLMAPEPASSIAYRQIAGFRNGTRTPTIPSRR